VTDETLQSILDEIERESAALVARVLSEIDQELMPLLEAIEAEERKLIDELNP
jgi:hypothetical protein